MSDYFEIPPIWRSQNGRTLVLLSQGKELWEIYECFEGVSWRRIRTEFNVGQHPSLFDVHPYYLQPLSEPPLTAWAVMKRTPRDEDGEGEDEFVAYFNPDSGDGKMLAQAFCVALNNEKERRS